MQWCTTTRACVRGAGAAMRFARPKSKSSNARADGIRITGPASFNQVSGPTWTAAVNSEDSPKNDEGPRTERCMALRGFCLDIDLVVSELRDSCGKPRSDGVANQ